jgi:anhydro-N-acetylmuramic acid kinase
MIENAYLGRRVTIVNHYIHCSLFCDFKSMDSNQQFKVLGLMSGTSLDGVDIALCTFRYQHDRWTFAIQQATTVSYPREWLKKLAAAHTLSGEQLTALDTQYGKYLGSLCNNFLKVHNIRGIDFIASHGHTVFHQPATGFTLQIGNGNAIHAQTTIPVVYDFRSLDVQLGGQGAPLVPIGDRVLFGEYDVCMNLGGIANISAEGKKGRIAFDVCYVNMGLNYLASKAGKKYDRNGMMAQKGEVNKTLFQKLEKIYGALKLKRPSLGRELFEKKIQPLLDDDSVLLADRLCTFTEVAAHQLAGAFREVKNGCTVLCTGGGTFNSYFMYRLIDCCGDDATLVIPDEEIVKYKEALVFALLGVLRVQRKVNCLKSVTHASKDSSSGVMVGF